jgi:hypothetical protein
VIMVGSRLEARRMAAPSWARLTGPSQAQREALALRAEAGVRELDRAKFTRDDKPENTIPASPTMSHLTHPAPFRQS